MNEGGHRRFHSRRYGHTTAQILVAQAVCLLSHRNTAKVPQEATNTGSFAQPRGLTDLIVLLWPSSSCHPSCHMRSRHRLRCGLPLAPPIQHLQIVFDRRPQVAGVQCLAGDLEAAAFAFAEAAPAVGQAGNGGFLSADAARTRLHASTRTHGDAVHRPANRRCFF